MNGPPPRLLDDPATDGALREDLERAETSPVQAYDRDRGLARLRAAIAVGAGGDGGGGGGSSGAGSAAGTGATAGAAKWIGIVLVGGLAVGGGITMLNRASPQPVAPSPQAESPSPAHEAPGKPAPVAAPAPAPKAPTKSPAEALTPEPTEPKPTVESTTPRARHDARHAVASAVDPDDALRRETAHLAETRRLAVRDPQAALSLAERGHREFPHGMFREEREAIAIFALDELGRTRAARGRATAFLELYPNGPFSERMRRTVLATPTR